MSCLNDNVVFTCTYLVIGLILRDENISTLDTHLLPRTTYKRNSGHPPLLPSECLFFFIELCDVIDWMGCNYILTI